MSIFVVGLKSRMKERGSFYSIRIVAVAAAAVAGYHGLIPESGD